MAIDGWCLFVVYGPFSPLSSSFDVVSTFFDSRGGRFNRHMREDLGAQFSKAMSSKNFRTPSMKLLWTRCVAVSRPRWRWLIGLKDVVVVCDAQRPKLIRHMRTLHDESYEMKRIDLTDIKIIISSHCVESILTDSINKLINTVCVGQRKKLNAQ